MPSLSVYNIIRIYSKIEDYKTETKTCVDSMNTMDRKWQQPQLQLHLVIKSCSRRELGLLTSSIAVHPQKMMPCMMF